MYILLLEKIIGVIYKIVFYIHDKLFYLKLDIDDKYIDYIMKH